MHSEKLTNLIKMANQIAANICLQAQDEQAILKVTNHLALFWAKSMKQEIIAYCLADGKELSNEAKRAVERLNKS